MIKKEIISLLKQKVQKIEAVHQENDIYLVGPIQLPVELDGEVVTFNWYSWLSGKDLPDTTEEMIERISHMNLADYQQSSVLAYDDFEQSEEAYIRFHSICHTGDIFGSQRCDCGYQLKQSMRQIIEKGSGALFYLANHEGRGIGLFSKSMTYLLQENGYDTVDANLALGFDDDVRVYKDAIAVLRNLREKSISLLTNNPKKIAALEKEGMKVKEAVPLWGNRNQHNQTYLETKINKSGHIRK